MPISNIEKFNCPICGYITTDKNTIERIKLTTVCPACRNGRGKAWKSTNHKPIHSC